MTTLEWCIARKFKDGWSPPAIAARMGIPLADVENAIRKFIRPGGRK